jgi:hypothetical protein
MQMKFVACFSADNPMPYMERLAANIAANVAVKIAANLHQ